MESTSQNSQLNNVLNNVLGLDEDDSLLSQNDEHHEDSDDAYDGPEHYLHSDDEDVINKLFEEMNQPEQEKSISVSDGEEYESEEECDEQPNSANDDNFSDQQYMEGPLVDMVYCSVESFFAFYKEHSLLNGFGVLKKTSKKRGCEYARYVSFACDKSRKPTAKNYSKRVDCKCKVNCVVLPDGSCRVTTVTTEHNHELQPSLTRFFGCHRKISKALKRNLEAHDIAGIRPAKSIRLLEVQAGGPDRMGCTPKDCRNYILQQCKMRTLSCDVVAIQKLFASMQMKDDEFFYVIDTDKVGRLRNVVWVHTHCKYAYREFSDVVCFDSTYLVNQWRMPFASFVGVNQHKQSILLGCALLTSDDIKTYKFVFSTWLAAMGNEPPTAILTDQCESIKAAIAELQTHYTRPIYDAFAAEHLKRLYHCEIERHHDFNVVEGVEKYILRRWRRDVIRPHIGKFFQGGYPSMTDEYKKYNSLKKWFDSLKKWFDRNCDVVLDNNAKYADFKNVLKGCFNAYCNWNDEMAVPNVGDPDSEEDVTFIRNPREVRTRGRPPTNRCRRGGGRWNRIYYHADQVGETSQARKGGGRRGVGRRAGRGGRGDGIKESN
ncbi:hypothetical protein KY285_024117 [Solanum tuberosum]|nr:hypothetical protein KY289_024460 [Solanum tuberosum]KAH0676316.1 hypothetical protein KY285_024117 [Solanum tuberosum]